ncbi:exopolygalacturonate lyase, partial [Vibrio furnissii]
MTFGQSTDLNFGSTILPEKVGLNHVVANGQEVQPGPVASQFTIESRGGKIANSHEGGTFYYTELPTDVNFTLSANVTIDQLGPETGS